MEAPLAPAHETGSPPIPAGTALLEFDTLLDRIEPNRSALDPGTRLQWAELARRVAERVAALAGVLVGEADLQDASLRANGTPMSSWLTVSGNLSRRESAGLLHNARALAGHPVVGEAAVAGRIGSSHARAITGVMAGLEDRLDENQRRQAELKLVELAGQLDADRLARAAGQVLAEVVPQEADELLERKLQDEVERAHRSRSLRFFRDGRGSVRFDGSLPRVDAEAWLALLDAHAESQRRTALEERDPLAQSLTPEQRRADALIGMIRQHSVTRQAPSSGGDRPRVHVLLDYDRLLRDAAGAGLIAEDEQLSAGELRRLCCDAELLPAVLNGRSEVLDVGRASRLVTPAIRAALTVRDRGCVFPGCQARPAVCEAHHIKPWWAGGTTSTTNLVLLCHHHHALVEPAKYTARDQWEVRLAEDGVAEVIPPARLDAKRRPLRHQRLPATDAGMALRDTG